jgi:DNA-binding NtrC family response regulator
MMREWNFDTTDVKQIVIGTLDNKIVDSLNQKFKGSDFHVHIVQKGLDILTTILDQKVDLLIIDVDLAGMMGVDILPIVKKLRPRLPVILITDDYNLRIRKIAAEIGVRYQAFKPISDTESNAIASASEKIIEKSKEVFITT